MTLKNRILLGAVGLLAMIAMLSTPLLACDPPAARYGYSYNAGYAYAPVTTQYEADRVLINVDPQTGANMRYVQRTVTPVVEEQPVYGYAAAEAAVPATTTTVTTTTTAQVPAAQYAARAQYVTPGAAVPAYRPSYTMAYSAAAPAAPVYGYSYSAAAPSYGYSYAAAPSYGYSYADAGPVVAPAVAVNVPGFSYSSGGGGGYFMTVGHHRGQNINVRSSRGGTTHVHHSNGGGGRPTVITERGPLGFVKSRTIIQN